MQQTGREWLLEVMGVWLERLLATTSEYVVYVGTSITMECVLLGTYGTQYGIPVALRGGGITRFDGCVCWFSPRQ